MLTASFVAVGLVITLARPTLADRYWAEVFDLTKLITTAMFSFLAGKRSNH
jgi:hypothetical protein